MKKKIAYLFQITLLAITYFISGNFCNYVGIPNEFGTIIWPPSGISLAAVLLLGPRISVGILLGAFFTNLFFLEKIYGLITPLSVITAIIESCGAALQAFAGARLLSRFAHYPNSLANERQLFLFFFVSMLGAFFSATIAITTLTLTGQISYSDALSHWTDWYLGDVMGIFIFTPLLLVLFSPDKIFHDRRLVVSMTILSAFILTAYLVYYEFQEEKKRFQFEFEKDALAIHAKIEKQLFSHLNALRSIESFYAASEVIDRADFKAFVAHLFTDFAGIQALGFDQWVLDSQRVAFEESIQKEGFANFYITEKDENKKIIPATRRESYVVVTFIEPMLGNEKVFGFNMTSDPVRETTLIQARDLGIIASTPKITLVQESGNQSGFIAFIPIYKNDYPHQTLIEKQQNIHGFAVAVFRIGDMVSAALKDFPLDDLTIRIFDENSPADNNILFDYLPNSSNTIVLDPNLPQINLKMDAGNRIWRIEVSATKNYIKNRNTENAKANHINNSWHILLIGLFLTSLMGGLALLITGRKIDLEQTLRIRTTELKKSEENFRTMANAAPVLIWLSGTDTLFCWLNQVWLDFVGSTLENELGNFWAEGVHPDDVVHSHATYIASFNLQQPFKIEYRLKHHSGEYRWILNTGIPRFSAFGDFEGYIGTCIDITDFKNTEKMMNEAKEAAEALAQSKTNFLANMSHEIRTPMNAIIGLSQLALSAPEEQQSSYLEKILGASENLLTILNDILDFSKLDSKGIAIVYDEFNLDTLANNLNNLFSITAQQKNITFMLDIDADIARHLVGDELRLQQVLINLLNNGFKFTQTGFVRLKIATAKHAGDTIWLTFSVIDSGIGMNQAQLKLLFQPFSQADTSISRRFGGSGLGLVISQKFVGLMGGEITCKSIPNQGSEFSFSLPFKKAKTNIQPDSVISKKTNLAEKLAEAAERLTNVRVLLVEDTPLNQKVASEFLRRANLDVTIAENGQEAIEILKHHHFDIVLMDIQMPVMDGLEATKIIRQNPHYADLPIIAVSAGVTLDEQEKYQSAGMNDFIAKPINPLKMLEKISQNLIIESN